MSAQLYAVGRALRAVWELLRSRGRRIAVLELICKGSQGDDKKVEGPSGSEHGCT